MIGCSLKGYVRTCAPLSGGADILLIGDANDFDLTADAAATDGSATGYTAIALRTGATALGGAKLYEITSLEDTLGVDFAQSNADGSTSSWEYTVSARMAQMSQEMAVFNQKLDAAAACCQIIVVWRNHDGRIFVAGEKYVDGVQISKFKLRQDGSKVTTGKKFSDFNGQDLSLKGNYSRLPYEFTGGFAAIQALM